MEKIDRDQLIYAGIPTFMRCPYLPDVSAISHEIAVVGVPLDHASSYRDGAKHGPRSIREHSYWEDLDGGHYFDTSTGLVLNAPSRSIVDLGDITVHPTDPSRTNANIAASVSEIRKRAFPVILGGDHSITYGSFLGCRAGLQEKHLPIGILHFDAHLDLEEQFSVMPTLWHGNVFRSMIDEKVLLPEHLVTIGVRGLIRNRWINYAKTAGVHLYTAMDVNQQGPSVIFDAAVKHLNASCGGVYVTLDIDVIDPAQAPGTGTPVVGGLTAETILMMVRNLGNLNVVGFDLVEVNPRLDPSGRTSILASDILWQFLAFGLRTPII